MKTSMLQRESLSFRAIGTVATLAVAAGSVALGVTVTGGRSTPARAVSLPLEDTAQVVSAPPNGNGASHNLIVIGATNVGAARSALAPGDSVQRYLDLEYVSNSKFTVTLSTTAHPATALTNNATSSLWLQISRCPNAWAGSPGTYSCTGGGVQQVFAGGASQANAALANLLPTTSGTINHLLIQLSLPHSADYGAYHDLTTSMAFVFTATQGRG